MFSENFLLRGPISMILYLLGRGNLRGGPILIWLSSDDMINNKITEISNSYEQIIEIIINKIFKVLKHSFNTLQRFERISLFMN